MRLDPVDAARAALERGLAAIDRDTVLAEFDDIFRDGANQSSGDDDRLMREAIQETKTARGRRRRGG